MTRHPRIQAAAQLDAEMAANFGKPAKSQPQPQPAPAITTAEAANSQQTGRIELPPIPPNSQPQAPDGDREAYWNQRLSTQAGMLKSLTRQNEELTELVQQLQQQLQARPAAPAAPPTLLDYFSQEDIDELGEDYCRRQLGAMLKLEKRSADLTAQAVRQAVAPLETKLAESSKNDLTRKQQAFYDQLNREVSGWDGWAVKGKEDPRFSEWLTHTVSPYSVETRESVLHAAQARWDATVVVSLLRDFLRSLGIDPTQSIDPTSRQIPVSGSGGGGDPPPRQTRQDTRMALSEIQQFQKDFGRGKYKGRAKEALEIQTRIDAAYLSKNIDPNR
jgi:hypothetical protein